MVSWLKDVKSGLRIALTTVVGIVIIGLQGKGLRLLNEGAQRNVAVGIGMVLASSSLLLVTAGRWAKWFFAGCCLITLRAAVFGLLGRTVSVPSIAAPRIQFFEIGGIFAAMALFSYRFIDSKPNWVDAVCLTVSVIAVVDSLVANRPTGGLLVSLTLLGACSAYKTFVSHDHRKFARPD